MIVKMIQNLENNLELQINSLETRIEKMQEKFNKDLEEIKKSQSIMNNAITEIKFHPRANKFQSNTYHANSPEMQEHSPVH